LAPLPARLGLRWQQAVQQGGGRRTVHLFRRAQQGGGQPRRRLHEATRLVHLPEQVAGMVFKITQQQADHLVLAIGPGLGFQPGAK
jgi:hypothetical protein